SVLGIRLRSCWVISEDQILLEDSTGRTWFLRSRATVSLVRPTRSICFRQHSSTSRLSVKSVRNARSWVVSQCQSLFFHTLIGFGLGFSSNIRRPIVSMRVLIRVQVPRYRSFSPYVPRSSSRKPSSLDLRSIRSTRLRLSGSVIPRRVHRESRLCGP